MEFVRFTRSSSRFTSPRAPTRRFRRLTKQCPPSICSSSSEHDRLGVCFTDQIQPASSALLPSKPRSPVSRGFELSNLSELIHGCADFREAEALQSPVVLEVCCLHLSTNILLISWKHFLLCSPTSDVTLFTPLRCILTMNIFQLPPPPKRKRSFDDVKDENLEHQSKRKATASLAIRPSPLKVRPLGPAFGSFNPPAPLTPDDTSGDESIPEELGTAGQPLIHRNTSNLSDESTNSTSSMAVHLSPGRQQDTDMITSSPFRPCFGRARSNDLISPPRIATTDSSFLTPPQSVNPLNDRIPTPINSTFDNRLNHLPAAPRHQFPPLRKFLSPMMEQEPFAAPPTPVEDTMQDADIMVGYEQTSNSMSGLKVSCNDDDIMDQDMDTDDMRAQVTGSWGLDGAVGQEPRISGRIAKLHMGFMPGCSRCVQKVPGHYSHIIWEGPDGSKVVKEHDF